MKITIYIVDDEIMAIQYFHYLLENIKADYEVIGEATNSVKALQEILRLKPDIIFADINMPILDGLELSEKILDQIHAKIFLLTSYRDFDYVKKGISIGVTDYILKNDLTKEVLEKLLEKHTGDLYMERKQQHLILEYNVRRFLLSDTDYIEDYSYRHRPMQRYALLGFWQKNSIHIRRQTVRKKTEADCFELHNLSYPDGVFCSAFTVMQSGEICGVFFINSEVADSQVLLEKAADGVLNALEKHGDVQYQCVISETRQHFFELQNSYKVLSALSEYLYAHSQKRIFRAEELKKIMEEGTKAAELERFRVFMEDRQTGEALEALEALFSQWRANLTIWEYTEKFQNVYHYLKSYVSKNNLRPALMEIQEEYADAASAEAILKKCVEKIQREQEEHTGEIYSPHVQQAIAYIHRNYRKEVSVPDVAEAVGVSEGHLRRLFKQELNTKIVDYLTEYRVECAKLLMESREENPNDIWRKTGFTSNQYFSYVFKRREGMLPKDYIKKIRKH